MPVLNNHDYLVSNYGNIRSVKKGIKLVPQVAKRGGYLVIKIVYSGKKKCVKVHRLVAESFLLNPVYKPQVNHIDGNKLNNHVSNLEWATASENIKHAYALGLNPGNKEHLSKLVIAKNIKTGEIIKYSSIREAGRELNIFGQNICSVLSGRSKTAKGYVFTNLLTNTK